MTEALTADAAAIGQLRDAIDVVDRAASPLDVDELLRALTALEAITRGLKEPVVRVLRSTGRPWLEIAELLDVSPQGAWQRFRHLDTDKTAEVSPRPSSMREAALRRIEDACGSPPDRTGGREQTYRTPNGRLFHLRTRAPDARRHGQQVFWFGIQERFWQPDHFFVLACGLEFCLVVPVEEWLPFHDDICLSMAQSASPAGQPHIYAEGSVVELREGQRVVDVRPWMDRFDLLAV